MRAENELTRNIMMHHHNVHGRTGGRDVRIHEKTTFLAQKRVVVHSRQRTQQRWLPFLPLKHSETREYLKIPKEIMTEDQLLAYVEEKKPGWLDHHSGRSKRRPPKGRM